MEETLISPRKLLLGIIFVITAAGLASASDIYLAQNPQGGNTGADCNDAKGYTFFNSSANWGSAIGQIGAGTTVHLCGTINGAAGGNILSFHGSGTSTNPITVKFESNAIIQEPYFGSGGSSGITVSGYNFITIDGGGSGLIQATQNGTNGTSACPAGACTHQVNPTTAIEAMSSSNLTIKGLTCDNIYVQTASDSVGNTGISCVHFQGSNVSIHDSTLANAGEGIDNTEYGNDNNTQIYNNDFHEDGWALGCAGGTHVNTNYFFYNNHVHDPDRWTNGGGATHINGIHCFGAPNGPGTGIQSFYLYNNVFDGNMGSCCWTAWVYLESNGLAAGNWDGNTGTLYAFNNVFVDSLGLGNASLQTGGGVNHFVVDNSFYGTPYSGTCLQWGGTGTTIENNVFNNCGAIMFADPHSGLTPSYNTIDYNLYGKAQSGNALWHVNSMSISTLSTWQSACNCDRHSQAQLGSLLAGITDEGVPSPGFIGIQQGADLMSLATGNLSALAFDTGAGKAHTPVPRPSGSCSSQGASGCWEIGAYFGSGSPAPQSPTALTAVVE
jgi:hypothetical protein